ncbi:MAG TPA: hypothetical protein VNN77_00925 [candidate division Zixibacteria bacterium]|nr:hypothetical protein [candidate division Zixibacteria bacterium]
MRIGKVAGSSAVYRRLKSGCVVGDPDPDQAEALLQAVRRVRPEAAHEIEQSITRSRALRSRQ